MKNKSQSENASARKGQGSGIAYPQGGACKAVRRILKTKQDPNSETWKSLAAWYAEHCL
jgi:hypothetical protein